MIQLTENAAGAVQSAITGASSPVAGLRVAVQAGGCSGFQYEIGLVESVEPADIACESRGVRIFIDPSSFALLTGTTIDFIDSLEGVGFSFDNPQAKSKCGCGKSFCS
jgi:iron-sulfur cluster assembly protein